MWANIRLYYSLDKKSAKNHLAFVFCNIFIIRVLWECEILFLVFLCDIDCIYLVISRLGIFACYLLIYVGDL